MSTPPLRLLFIVNQHSGSNAVNYKEVIRDYFNQLSHVIEIYELTPNCSPQEIKARIKAVQPQRVVAVGGDGTVKLVAECLLNQDIPLAILPAGSANGMAKELNIPVDSEAALEIATSGKVKKIHAVTVNNELCIHLADIGFNAFVVKKFEMAEERGMWAYIKAAWKVLLNSPVMQLTLQTDGKKVNRKAAMVVIANATKYGTGVVINPKGRLDDGLFEVVVVRKISFTEIFKMRVTHTPYNPLKTEVFQTTSLKINSGKKVHFQVDGEYLGKVNNVEAEIILNAVSIVVPAADK